MKEREYDAETLKTLYEKDWYLIYGENRTDWKHYTEP